MQPHACNNPIKSFIESFIRSFRSSNQIGCHVTIPYQPQSILGPGGILRLAAQSLSENDWNYQTTRLQGGCKRQPRLHLVGRLSAGVPAPLSVPLQHRGGVRLAQVAGRLLPFAGVGRGGFKHSRSVLADRVGACRVVRVFDAETRCIALAVAMPSAVCGAQGGPHLARDPLKSHSALHACRHATSKIGPRHR